jgi:1,4-alpha-glucan branching enzyme
MRAYYGYMWAHPGKKLLFMGQEFGQKQEWNFDQSLDWHLLEQDRDGRHHGLQSCIRELNRLHRTEPALYARDCEPEGFRWIVSDDRDQSIIGWLRMGAANDAPIASITNFTPVPRENYRIGLPHSGFWREILNTDSALFGGANIGNGGGVHAEPIVEHGFTASAVITVPPLATVYFRYEAG